MASQNPIAKTIQDTKDAQKIAEEKRTLPVPSDFVVLKLSEDDLYGGPENEFPLSGEGIFGFNEGDIDRTEDYIAKEGVRRLLNRFEAPQELVNILGQDVVEKVDSDTAYQKLLEKGYTRGDIIDQLTNLERVGLGEGFITEFPKATTAGYAGTRAARLTAPLGTPFGPFGQLVTGTIGFLGGAGLSYLGLDKIEDLIFGDTVPMPSQRGEFEAGRTLGGVGASPAMVFGMSKQGVNLGAADFVAQVAARNKAKEELFKSKKTRFLELQQKRDELLEKGEPLPKYLQGDLQATALTLEGVPLNKKVVSGIENLLNRFQKTATDKPLTFGAYEITSASGSAIGAYIAEQYGPASLVERGGAELLGGMTGSFATSAAERAGRLLSGSGSFIKNVYGGPRTTGEGVLRTGRYSEQFDKSFPGLVDFFKGADKKKTQAAQEILGRIIEAGEDPDAIIRLLNDPANAEAINSAAASRSPILQVIEAALMRDNQKLAKGSQQAYQETRAALRTNMMELVALGDIDSLAEAAKIQQTLFEDALETRLGSATNAVLDAADKLRGDGTPLSPEELAEKLYDTVTQSIKVARAQERALYNAIPDQEITRFLDPEGNEIDVPYFVERFNSSDMMPKTPELQDDLQNVYGAPIYNFIKRFSGADELAEFDLEDAIADAVRNSRGVSRARASFEKVSEELPSALDDSAELLKELRAVLPDFDDIPEGSIDEIKLLNKLINNPPKESGQYIVDRLRGNVDGGRVASLEARGKIRNVKKFLQARLRVDQVETAAEESARLRLGKKVTDSVEEKPLSVGQLREMASQARSKAAVYRQQGESNSERILNNMADSFLDTIESVENPDATDALRVARAYSKGFHDTFTRTFAGAITQDTRRQGRKISPEEMAKKILSGGSESARMRYKEVKNIIPFLDEAVQAGRITQQEVDELGSNIDGAFELILRGNRAEMLDPDTGVVNQRSLNKWINDPKNQRLLETFPTLMEDLQDVNKANVLLDETTKVNKDLQTERAAESVVARLALKQYEDPAIAIKDALAEKRPEKSIVQFIQSIRNADRETVEALIKQDPTLRRKSPKEVLDSGLKSSFLKMALLDGGGPFTGEFKAYKAYESLFEPIKYGRGKSSLMDILVAQKVFNKSEASSIKAMLSQLLEFEAKDAAGLDLELGKAPNPALDFWLRVSGAAAGARLQKMLPGDAQAGSLVAAGAGSKYFRQLFQEIPASMHLKAMGDLMQDPQALALFLKKAKDGQEGAGIARSLARWFVDRGYMTAARGVPFLNRESELFEEFFQDEEQPAAQPEPQPAPQPAAVPPVSQAPAPRPEVRVSQQQPRPAARPLQTSMAPPAPQGGSVNPQTAARLSAAFPEDDILAMASPAKSGIGSLMG